MRLSDKPTRHILIKAYTNSEWDSCDFALITLSEGWSAQQAARLQAIKPYANNYSFQSMNYYDGSADFYQCGADGEDIGALLGDEEWAFIELDKDEEKKLTPPESTLDCYKLVVYRDGNARYEAYGKHTSEEFWTDEFSLQQVIEQVGNAEHSEKPEPNAEMPKMLGYLTEQLRINGGGWDLTNDEGKATVFDSEKQVYIPDLILSKDNTPCAVIPLKYFDADTIHAIVEIVSL